MRFEDWLDVTSEAWLWFSAVLAIGTAALLLTDIRRHP